MRREYIKWHSERLGRDMELLLFGHGGSRVIVFPTRCGRFHDYEDFGLIEPLRERIENGWLQLYCVDSVDVEAFYCPSRPPAERIQRHQQYEDYILHEVVPFSEQQNRHSFLMTHGCSLGAYHAVNIALRHPERFGKAVGFSGRYTLTNPLPGFADLLDGYRDELVYLHTPLAFLPGAHEAHHLERLRRVEITIAVGETDPFLDSNLALSTTMRDKGIRHQLHIWERRAHCQRSWQQMSRLYL